MRNIYPILGLLISLISLISFSSCCTTKDCGRGQTTIVPYYNGKYILPSLPIDRFYLLINGKEDSNMSHVANLDEINNGCDSDVPTTRLNCCDKYTFHLMVSFNSGTIGPILLDSTIVRIKSKNGCMILDVDPHNN